MNRAKWRAICFSILSCLFLIACGSTEPAPDTSTPSPVSGMALTVVPTVTRQLAITIVPTATWIPAITIVPTVTAAPTLSPTTSPSPVPTYTPTPVEPIPPGTPLPEPLQPISVSNASQVAIMATWQEESVVDMSWAPDGRTLAVANENTITLVDVRNREPLNSLTTDGNLISIAYNPSGDYLAAGYNQGSEQSGYRGKVALWETVEYNPLKPPFDEEKRGISQVSFSLNGIWFASAFSGLEYEENSGVNFWDMDDPTITSTYKTGTALEITFSPDDRRMATTPDRYTIQLWGIDSGSLLDTIFTSFTGAVGSLVFSPDGTSLASGHYDGTIRIWDAVTGDLIFTIQTDGFVNSLAYSPDGTVLASGNGYHGNQIQLWDPTTGQPLRTLEGHNAAVDSLSFSPDGGLLASGSYDGTVILWGVRP